jgi:hypothetical protein
MYLLELGSYEMRNVIGVFDTLESLNQAIKIITDSYNEYCDCDDNWIWYDDSVKIPRFTTDPDEITITNIELNTLQDRNYNVFKLENNNITYTHNNF